MKKYLRQTGFSMIETLVSITLLSGLSVGYLKYRENSLKSFKISAEKKALHFISQNLKNILEDDVVCKNAFSDLPWDQIVNQNITIQNDKIHLLPNLYKIEIGGQTLNAKELATNLQITGVNIYQINPSELAGMSLNEYRTIPIKVHFPVAKGSQKMKLESTRRNLTQKPITIVSVFKKTSESNPVFDHCYVRGSSLISEVREVCHSMGGIYREEGCLFIEYGKSQPNPIVGEARSDSNSWGFKTFAEVICEMDKQAIQIETQELAPIPVTGTPIIPGHPATKSITKFCEIPVKNF